MSVHALLASPELLLGKVENAYLAHAQDPTVRDGAASGGVVSAILLYLLKNDYIDGAVVSRLRIKDGKIGAEAFIARSPEQILAARGSIYMEFSMRSQLRELADMPGRFAVVGLPCQLEYLREFEQEFRALRDKVAFRIGLFCSGTSHKELLIQVLRRQGISEADVRSLRFKTGHWRGKTRVELVSGETCAWPYFKGFGLYRNLYLYTVSRCLSCMDQTAELADISCGDAWLAELKEDPIKHTLTIARSPDARALLENIQDSGELELREISLEDAFAAQRRPLIYKKRNFGARKRLGRLFGFNIRGEALFKPQWNDYIGAFFVLLNVRLSRNKFACRIINALPRVLLWPYMCFISLMKHF